MSEIKVGDFIRIKGVKSIVKVIDVCSGRYAVDGMQFYTIFCDSDGLERLDPKTAFLAELKALLEKYDAKIELAEDEPECPYIKFYIGEEFVSYESLEPVRVGDYPELLITPDNIMDYDKE